MVDVVTLGECMTLLFPPAGVELARAESLRIDLAGAESNLAIAMARLGHSARLITRVGDDPFGVRLRATLELEGVATDALILDPQAPSGLFFREHLEDGRRRVFYYRKGSAASRLAPEDIQTGWFEGARLLHLTGITPALSPTCAGACERAIELAREVGAWVSFDPNYRPKLWGQEAARESLIPLMKKCDFLLMGHEDAAAVLGETDPENALRVGEGLGVRCVVLKRAELGASALVDGVRYDCSAERVEKVIDPVGAGDGFNAGFLAGQLRGWGVEASLRLGARIGAAAVQVEGDYAGYPHGL